MNVPAMIDKTWKRICEALIAEAAGSPEFQKKPKLEQEEAVRVELERRLKLLLGLV